MLSLLFRASSSRLKPHVAARTRKLQFRRFVASSNKMDTFYENLSKSAMQWSKDDIWFHLWKQEKVAALKEDFGGDESDDGLELDDSQPLAWINIPFRSLSLRSDLRGRIVVVDFFTTCCINCIHSLVELKQVQETIQVLEPTNHSTYVSWIGVHSPKFDYERETAVVKHFCEKYGIVHPVVNDRNNRIWSQFGASVWPTIVVLSPRGQILFKIVGEGYSELLSRILTESIRFYKEKSLLDSSSALSGSLSSNRTQKWPPPMSALKSPSKMALDPNGKRIFVSDSGNSRIVVFNKENVEAVGQIITAGLNFPHGLALHQRSNCLVISDTGNHCIKSIEIDSGRVVSTLKLLDLPGASNKKTKPSPWDVVAHGDLLYVAMAGYHQIWTIKLAADGSLSDPTLFAGDGIERKQDSPDPLKASFAQPSGLAILGSNLHVADSESSSIRTICLDTGRVQTLCGGDEDNPNNLFAYGDVDHHLPGKVSYNGKIKAVNPSTGKTVNLTGLQHQLKEPDAIFYDNSSGAIFVVDSASNCLRKLKVSDSHLQQPV